MTSQENTNSQTTKQGFKKSLDRHGYGFHYSVLKVAKELYQRNKSKWIFEVAEFPVDIQGKGTRIDFILKLHRYPQEPDIYLLAECKRANPALSNWCFARAPYVRRNRTTSEPIFLEHAKFIEDMDFVNALATPGFDQKKRAYHIGLEVKSNESGDSGSGRGAIESAATQICRGLNGMIEFIAENTQILNISKEAYFFPVIFTTAKLWASDVDLSSANLENGKINIEDADFIEKPWLFYQYHLSPGIKHSASPDDRPPSIGSIMDSEYVRTIAIVNSSGIESFLRWSSDTDFYLTW